MKDKCGRQVWETIGTQVQTHAAKLMGPKEPRVGDKCGKYARDKCKLMRPKAPRVGDKCEKYARDKCKLMRPKAPREGEKCV